MKQKAWIRFYFKIDPDQLSEEDFYLRWIELSYCLKKTGRLKEE